MLQTRTSRLLASLGPVVRAQRRTLWRCSTLISSSPSSLLSHIESLEPPAQSAVTLFALSKNTPQDVVPRFRAALSRDGTSTLGTLSELVPASLLSRLAPSLSANVEPFYLSLATYEPSSPSDRAIPFRSTLTGRPNIALGREIKPDVVNGERADEGVDAGFEAFLRGEKWGFGDQAGAKVGNAREIEELKGVECVARTACSSFESCVSDGELTLLLATAQPEGRQATRRLDRRPNTAVPQLAFDLLFCRDGVSLCCS